MKIGDYVYVGDALRKQGEETRVIFRYTLIHDTWSRLPKCPTFQHGLASLNDELIVIGGLISSRVTNVVYTFRDDTWQQILPPMPTPRYHLCTISHENRLIIAAGGSTSLCITGE